jgi:hypothetical protein
MLTWATSERPCNENFLLPHLVNGVGILTATLGLRAWQSLSISAPIATRVNCVMRMHLVSATWGWASIRAIFYLFYVFKITSGSLDLSHFADRHTHVLTAALPRHSVRFPATLNRDRARRYVQGVTFCQQLLRAPLR